MTVATETLYKENRLDQAELRSPKELAAEFVATLEGERYPEYRPSGSLRIDDQFAWWLGDPKAENSTWDRDDWPVLMDALGELIDSDESARRTILDAINP
jgi:hypothetical protein